MLNNIFWRIRYVYHHLKNRKRIAVVKEQIRIIRTTISKLPQRGYLLTESEQTELLEALAPEFRSWPAAILGDGLYTGYELTELICVLKCEFEPYDKNDLRRETT